MGQEAIQEEEEEEVAMTSTPLPEQGGFNERLDSILRDYIGNYVTADEYERHVTEAQTAIRTLVLEEVLDRLSAEVKRAYDKEGDFLEMVITAIEAERKRINKIGKT